MIFLSLFKTYSGNCRQHIIHFHHVKYFHTVFSIVMYIYTCCRMRDCFCFLNYTVMSLLNFFISLRQIIATIYSQFSRSFTARGCLLGTPPGYKTQNKSYGWVKFFLPDFNKLSYSLRSQGDYITNNNLDQPQGACISRPAIGCLSYTHILSRYTAG